MYYVKLIKDTSWNSKQNFLSVNIINDVILLLFNLVLRNEITDDEDWLGNLYKN